MEGAVASPPQHARQLLEERHDQAHEGLRLHGNPVHVVSEPVGLRDLVVGEVMQAPPPQLADDRAVDGQRILGSGAAQTAGELAEGPHLHTLARIRTQRMGDIPTSAYTLCTLMGILTSNPERKLG